MKNASASLRFVLNFVQHALQVLLFVIGDRSSLDDIMHALDGPCVSKAIVFAHDQPKPALSIKFDLMQGPSMLRSRAQSVLV